MSGETCEKRPDYRSMCGRPGRAVVFACVHKHVRCVGLCEQHREEAATLSLVCDSCREDLEPHSCRAWLLPERVAR